MTDGQRNYPPPAAEAGKKPQVAAMFDAIAPRYDLANRVLSLGIDRRWRRLAVRYLTEGKPDRVLDVATGTGDLALAALEAGPDKVVGVDIAEEMLEVGRRKVAARGLEDRIQLQYGDAEKLPFSDRQFDAALVAFGVRNFENLPQGLSEIHRVLRPGGRLVVLEFSRPRAWPIRVGYGLYSRFLLPHIGRMLTGDSGAYRYLPDSIRVFPDGEDFLGIVRQAGFSNTRDRRLTFGIASLYIADA